MLPAAPRLFVSYSHDSQAHKDWVLALATRLLANGVDFVFDQWDLTLGSDLARFMEAGLIAADRVLAVCTAAYVGKANAGRGGVGYEKVILTAQLMRDVTADRIIPIIRDNALAVPVPTFLDGRVYIDFRDDASYEATYAELIHDVHGRKVSPRPRMGPNPFVESTPAPQSPRLSHRPERYISPGLQGRVTFDYSNNNGHFVIGAGGMAFETRWTGASRTSIYALSDGQGIRSVALAAGVRSAREIDDAGAYDPTSHHRSPHLGETVVWQNTAGYYAATTVESVKSRSHGDPVDEVTFSYVIQPDRSGSFRPA